MTYIEQVLRTKTNGQDNAILVGQWEYDKQLIPAALNAVSTVFPHYSLHDETHSISIINNIIRIIGKSTIDEMSPTDLWLLLEAAYCHDLGMVITAEEIENSLNKGSFVSYFRHISTDTTNPLYKYCNCFKIEDDKIIASPNADILSIHDSTKFLLSGFFREQHGQNSKKIILNPQETLAISSPRAIIPQRIYRILGDICMTHTANFDSLMNLPQVEVGIGLDEAHPRFVASLLRLGDVLDIDNPRFSETLLKTIKEMPFDSQLHKGKHLSITHLRIDTKKIEIIAECSNPKIAQVTQEWFNNINNEFMNQSLKWNDIVPSNLHCCLPNINYLKTNIEGYISINKNFKECFTIDTPKALELLQGKNFYASKFDSIRELLQNAVDSSLIKFYVDYKNKPLPNSPQELYNESLSNYCIEVNVKQIENAIEISIKDYGIGLSKNRMKYLTHTGSSSNDIDKQLIINNMPEWMRPSGIFGIGFQSVFLLTSEVYIQTKDYVTDEKLSLELHSPNSGMKGEIFLKQLNENITTGFSISFKISNHNFEDNYTDPFGAIQRITAVEQIIEHISAYAKSSMIPIKINGNIIERTQYDYFDSENKIELKFENLEILAKYSTKVEYRYRNANIGIDSLAVMFLHPSINIHFGNAKSLLTLSRDKINKSELFFVENRIISSIANYINSPIFTEKKYNDISKILFSFYVNQKKLNNKVKTPLPQLDSFKFLSDISFKEIIDSKYIYFLTTNEIQIFSIKKENENIIISVNSLAIMQIRFFYEYAMFLFDVLSDKKKNSFCYKLSKNNGFLNKEFLFTDEIDRFTELSINDINDICRINSQRNFIHYISGYDEIMIPATFTDDRITYDTDIWIKNKFSFQKILSPFIRINDKNKDCRNEEFYKYVSKANGKSIEDIKRVYDKFVDDCYKIGIKTI